MSRHPGKFPEDEKDTNFLLPKRPLSIRDRVLRPSLNQESRANQLCDPKLPNIGGNDLNPLGPEKRGGGMLLDPSDIGIRLSRPKIPIPKGTPRLCLPIGAKFDPITTPDPYAGYRKAREEYVSDEEDV